MIDSHCHLHYDYAPKSASDLVREAAEAGVHTLVTVGVDLETAPAVAAISESFPRVFHTAGIHPHDASGFPADGVETLRRLAAHPKCVAIGEIGLDYYYEHSDRKIQIESLERQLDLAKNLEMPIVIHSREGEADLLPRLRSFAQGFKHRLGNDRPPGVIHCFTGTTDFGLACIDLGFLISFSGIVTFKTADNVRAAARSFPWSRLLVETDSPYLAPIPYRGKKCEPKMVAATALFLSQYLGLDHGKFVESTVANAQSVFGLA